MDFGVLLASLVALKIVSAKTNLGLKVCLFEGKQNPMLEMRLTLRIEAQLRGVKLSVEESQKMGAEIIQ